MSNSSVGPHQHFGKIESVAVGEVMCVCGGAKQASVCFFSFFFFLTWVLLQTETFYSHTAVFSDGCPLWRVSERVSFRLKAAPEFLF